MGFRRIDIKSLKSIKSSVVVVLSVVSLSAASLCLAGWLCFDGGDRYAALVCCALSGGGVIWLGWQWLRLAGEVGSTALLFGKKEAFRLEPAHNAVMERLVEAINEHLQGNVKYIGELEKQVKDMQIKIQLLRKQKNNTDAIIYSIRDAVIVVDESDRLLIANESTGKLFGFDFRQSGLKPVAELISDDKSELTEFLRRSRCNKQPIRREIEFATEDKPRIFDCRASSVLDEQSQICGIVAILHDVTREKEISQMKNDFVSHVSHELKTPLASITAYSEMLVDGEANDEQTRREFYSVIQNQAERLNRMIENILNISRIESGLMRVDKNRFSLSMLIEEQLAMVKSYAQEKGVSLSRAGDGKELIVFDQVYADKDLISQVIVNLLSNAIKYTPSGGNVTVETEVSSGGPEDVVKISVTDTGVGIPADQLEYVFDKFYRVKANEGQAKGSGLGLNLVKQIAEKIHGGRVFVESQEGIGSTFGFELPMAKGETAEAVASHHFTKSIEEN